MAQEFLVLKNINKKFTGVQALGEVDLSIKAGEIHCLVGQNGCGKSTLIKIISGVLKPERGAEIRLQGKRFHHLTAAGAIRNGIYVIYQDLSIFPNLSVAENIVFEKMLENRGQWINRHWIHNQAAEITARIGIELPLERLAGTLSIADRQLIAICRGIAGNVKFLILDEPTSSLTKDEVNLLFSVVKDLRQKGITTLFVSHRLNEIITIAERVTVLRDGKKVGTFESNELNDEKLIFLMTGKNIVYTRPSSKLDHQNCALEVKNLSKQGNFQNINFKLYRGEVLGITGLLGSGRSELALSIFGLNPPDTGEIFVDGSWVEIGNNRDAITAGIGLLPEDRMLQGLAMDISIETNIIIAVMRNLLSRFGFIHQKRKKELARQWVQDLAIKIPALDAPVKTLSGGNQQRVALAKWIAIHPKILILDGPTIGIDIQAKNGIYETIKKLAAQGVGIIIISDEAAEVFYNCHRVLIMHRGKIIREIDPGATTEKDFGNMNFYQKDTSIPSGRRGAFINGRQ
jgi:simple sugar transport system ATP-binding protein